MNKKQLFFILIININLFEAAPIHKIHSMKGNFLKISDGKEIMINEVNVIQNECTNQYDKLTVSYLLNSTKYYEYVRIGL